MGEGPVMCQSWEGETEVNLFCYLGSPKQNLNAGHQYDVFLLKFPSGGGRENLVRGISLHKEEIAHLLVLDAHYQGVYGLECFNSCLSSG